VLLLHAPHYDCAMAVLRRIEPSLDAVDILQRVHEDSSAIDEAELALRLTAPLKSPAHNLVTMPVSVRVTADGASRAVIIRPASAVDVNTRGLTVAEPPYDEDTPDDAAAAAAAAAAGLAAPATAAAAAAATSDHTRAGPPLGSATAQEASALDYFSLHADSLCAPGALARTHARIAARGGYSAAAANTHAHGHAHGHAHVHRHGHGQGYGYGRGGPLSAEAAAAAAAAAAASAASPRVRSLATAAALSRPAPVFLLEVRLAGLSLSVVTAEHGTPGQIAGARRRELERRAATRRGRVFRHYRDLGVVDTIDAVPINTADTHGGFMPPQDVYGDGDDDGDGHGLDAAAAAAAAVVGNSGAGAGRHRTGPRSVAGASVAAAAAAAAAAARRGHRSGRRVPATESAIGGRDPAAAAAAAGSRARALAVSQFTFSPVSVRRRELCLLTVSTILARQVTFPTRLNYELGIDTVQLDNMLQTAEQKVILHRAQPLPGAVRVPPPRITDRPAWTAAVVPAADAAALLAQILAAAHADAAAADAAVATAEAAAAAAAAAAATAAPA
jgi:hypothetical protein